MKNKVRKHGGRGFTLVEIVVVLVILGILLAIALPSVIANIDKAQGVEHISQCRQCVTAAQTLSIERCAAKQAALALSDKAEILNTADVSGNIISLEAGGYTVSEMLYKAAGGRYVTFKDGVYTLGIATTTMGNPEIQQELLDNFESTGIGTIDSGAAGAEHGTNSHAHLVAGELAKAGLSFEALNAVSWQYHKNNNGTFFYWSPANITAAAPGDKVPVMRYNYTTGTYTVWIATVQSKTTSGIGTYNVFNSYEGYEASTKQTQAQQTYENMLEKYEEALLKYS